MAPPIDDTLSIDATVVADIAELAQLHLDADEVPEYIDSMRRILGLAAAMQSVDTDGVEPMSNPLDQTQRLRADVVTEKDQRESFQQIAPLTEDNLYLVPRVVE